MLIQLLLLIQASFACTTFEGTYLCDEAITVTHKLSLEDGKYYFYTNDLKYEADGQDHPVPDNYGMGLGKYNVSCYEDLIIAKAEFYREKNGKLLKTQSSDADITIHANGDYLYKKGKSIFYDELGNEFENSAEFSCKKQ